MEWIISKRRKILLLNNVLPLKANYFWPILISLRNNMVIHFLIIQKVPNGYDVSISTLDLHQQSR